MTAESIRGGATNYSHGLLPTKTKFTSSYSNPNSFPITQVFRLRQTFSCEYMCLVGTTNGLQNESYAIKSVTPSLSVDRTNASSTMIVILRQAVSRAIKRILLHTLFLEKQAMNEGRRETCLIFPTLLVLGHIHNTTYAEKGS